MKKIVAFICLSFALGLSACGGGDTEIKETKIKLNDNGVYALPSDPSDTQAKLYNKLSKAISAGDEEQIASLVAQNFAADFFTLKNKKSSQDVGGITYLPTSRQEEFKNFAISYVYGNYEKIKKDKGKGSLPVVKKASLETIIASEIEYINRIPADDVAGIAQQDITDTYDGYKVTITLSYEDTKVAAADLKSEISVNVINLDGKFVVVSIA